MTEPAAVNHEPDEAGPTRLMDVNRVRRAAIESARRVIARDGAGRLTLDLVAQDAGLPPGSLTNHFDNEQELLMTVAADDLAALAKSMRAGAQSGATSAEESPDLIQKVQGLETTIATMIDRHQKSLHERSDLASWVEQCVKDLQLRVATPDRQAPMLTEVKASLPPKADTRTERSPPAHGPRLVVEPPPMPGLPVVELTAELPPADSDPLDLPPVMEEQAAAPSSSQEAVPMDNVLLEARRAAIASQAGNERERDQAKRRSKRTRVIVGAFVGPAAILAAAAFMLNRNVVTATPVPAVVPPAAVVETTIPAAKQAVASPQPQGTPHVLPDVSNAQPTNPTPVQIAVTEPVDKLTNLAASGDMKAERDLGLKYLAGDGVQANDGEAARWLMRAAYRGEPTAEYWLGTLYARGHGVPADAFQANHWYEAAAKKGNRRAMHSLAVAYFQGWGVEKNYSEAARWFRSAADLGFVDAQFNLAVLYERGAGLQQSLTDAYKWYAVAAKGGDKEADARVAALATQLAPADLALAQQAAASFRPSPMDQNANVATGAEPAGG
jgi:localization factor PodJL